MLFRSDALLELKEDTKLISIFKELSDDYHLACCSNSILQTVSISLRKIGVFSYLDLSLSNENVSSSKPHPEIYWKAMAEFKVLPEETLIIEDSPHGLLAASRSGAHILRVSSPQDISLEKIQNKIKYIEKEQCSVPKWQGDNMNILIPMAGAGSRFQAAGYTFPKPLIDVNGKPMIQVVVENLNIEGT